MSLMTIEELAEAFDVPEGPAPTHAEMVPIHSQDQLPKPPQTGTHVCLPCDVTWVDADLEGLTCWSCGDAGQSVQGAEDMLGRPIIPRIWRGAASQNMALSEREYV